MRNMIFAHEMAPSLSDATFNTEHADIGHFFLARSVLEISAKK